MGLPEKQISRLNVCATCAYRAAARHQEKYPVKCVDMDAINGENMIKEGTLVKE